MNPSDPAPPEALNWLLQDLGPQSDDVASVVQDAENAWVVSFQNHSQVVLTWFHSPPRLELLTEVAVLEPQMPRERLEALLTFNLLTLDNAGARMALDPQPRRLFLLRDLPVSALELHPLRDAMRSLSATAEHWRDVLQPATPNRTPHLPSTQLTTTA